MARGTAPRGAAEAIGASTEEPAHTIAEALEQLLRAKEVEEAIAEWAREG